MSQGTRKLTRNEFVLGTLSAATGWLFGCSSRQTGPDAVSATTSELSIGSEIHEGPDRSSSDDSDEENQRLQAVLDGYELPASAVILELQSKKVVGAQTGPEHAFEVAHRPASTVKPLFYSAALASGQLQPDFVHECTGSMPNEPNWRCFKTHGKLSISDAIATSCNTFAWSVIDQIGYGAVRSAFESFGFGVKTGLVETEQAGLLHTGSEEPDGAYERLNGFGHGELRVTALQLAVAYGKLVTKIKEEPEKYAVIREGLEETVKSGTGVRAQVDGLSLWGKTGGAENLSDPNKMDGWFVALVPGPRPERVVVTHVLGGGGGSQTGAPLAKRVIEELLV